ncbi:anti-H(O) lectin 1-like [Tripterygium wilfordii]|uniref:anti-H(O) lectin 1-like n=1 Tax=Tripterygium wilfordii TaxID=458696 RepID=UPI0018F8304C|nr:anti-H(O) lectin 1-like [Tripterygium wilfordii]
MFVFLLLFAFLNQASSFTPAPFPFPQITTGFSFPSFTLASCSDGNLTCTGSVTSRNGYLSLTPEPQQGNPTLPLNQVGRVLYKYPLLAWPAMIYSKFTFRILTSPYSIESADGLTFIIAPDKSPSPSDSYGSYLGIMDPTKDGHADGQLAVEFDTYKNTNDLDANHIAIVTKSVLHPIEVRSLNYTGIDLKSGRDIKVLIVLDGRTKSIRVHVGYASDPIGETFLEVPIDIPNTLPSFIYVGFTASTGLLTERHQILNWNLASFPIKK